MHLNCWMISDKTNSLGLFFSTGLLLVKRMRVQFRRRLWLTSDKCVKVIYTASLCRRMKITSTLSMDSSRENNCTHFFIFSANCSFCSYPIIAHQQCQSLLLWQSGFLSPVFQLEDDLMVLPLFVNSQASLVPLAKVYFSAERSRGNEGEWTRMHIRCTIRIKTDHNILSKLDLRILDAQFCLYLALAT